MSTYQKWSTRSASDLLADLSACRSLRHMSDAQRLSITKYFFGEMEKPLADGKRLKSGRYFVWSYEALEVAFSHFGASCDCCGSVSGVPDDALRRTADRALENLDGRVKLMLCKDCSMRLTHFCCRHFDREVRVPYSDGLEKMMVAWLAFEVRQKAKRFMRNFWKSYAHNTGSCRDENNRFVSKGGDDAPDSRANRGIKKHNNKIPEGGGRRDDDLPVREASSAPSMVLGTLPEVTSPSGVHAALASETSGAGS